MPNLTRMNATSSSHALGKEYRDRTCRMDKCDAEAPESVSILLCANHLRIAWAAYQIASGVEQEVTASRSVVVNNPRNFDHHGSVYFAQVGKYVKIGWSSNVPRRMEALKASILYVTYPGTRADEFKAHKLFKKYLATGNEYFYPLPALMDYIKGLQAGTVPIPASVS